MKLRAMIMLLSGCVLFAQSAHAAKAPAGRVISMRGTATVTDGTGGSKKAVSRGTRIPSGSTIRTGPKSSVRILLADRSFIDLGASTVLRFNKVRLISKRRKVKFRVAVGRLWARVSTFFGGKSKFDVDTGNAVVGVRGTEFIVEVDEDGRSVVTVIRGGVELADLSGEQRREIGRMMTSTFDGKGPIEVKPADPARIAELAAAMAPRPHFTPQDVDTMREQGLLRKPPRVDPARLDIIDTPAPPLDDEPGAFGTARVNGTAEFED